MFTDHQADVPLAFCPICGSEIYAPGLEYCRECMEDKLTED